MTTQKRKILIMILVNLFGLGFAGKAVWADAESQSCIECHEEEVNSFQTGHHKKAWSSKSDTAENSCKACHGETAEHVKSKGETPLLLSFIKNIKTNSTELNDQCLNCHKLSTNMSFWDSGKHSRNNVACASCHKIHKGASGIKPSTDTCMGCHKEIKVQVSKRSHHPIEEGKVTCNDCHNPHGTPNKYNLREASINQTCYKCHADKRGPYMWEHMPVEENCTTCHDPHGSRHYKLLVEKVPNLCQNCHDWSRHPGTAYDDVNGFSGTVSSRFVGRACINCHVKIHGSTAPANPANGGNSGQFFLR